MKTTEAPRVFAISDLHLPGGSNKPMHIFGSHWEGHFDKIAQDWAGRVGERDIVLIPGDISWAMQLADATEDLRMIGALPGRKILTRGNHDYWWAAISRLREQLPDGMYALQNDALLLDDIVFCGSRGWMQPQGEQDEENRRIYQRELMRMRLSLETARRRSPEGRLIALCHYPPTDAAGRVSPMTELFDAHGASDVVYGHLHGQALQSAFEGTVGSVRYHCVSCDYLDFKLRLLPEPSVGAEAPLVAGAP